MPQIRAFLSIFAVLAFCIGFNIHRYPAVAEMVGGLTKPAEAKPDKAAATESKSPQGVFKKEDKKSEPAKDEKKSDAPPKTAVKKETPKKEEKKDPPLRRPDADPIPVEPIAKPAEPVRPAEPKEEKSDVPVAREEAKPAEPETVETRRLVPVDQLPAPDASKNGPVKTETFQRFTPWPAGGGRVEVQAFHRFPPVDTVELSQAKPSSIPRGTIPFYPTTK